VTVPINQPLVDVGPVDLRFFAHDRIEPKKRLALALGTDLPDETAQPACASGKPSVASCPEPIRSNDSLIDQAPCPMPGP
jgi:hypothetical protein